MSCRGSGIAQTGVPTSMPDQLVGWSLQSHRSGGSSGECNLARFAQSRFRSEQIIRGRVNKTIGNLFIRK